MLLLLLLLFCQSSLQWTDMASNSDHLVYSQMQSYQTANAQTAVEYSGAYSITCPGSGCCSDTACEVSRNANGE